MALRGYVRKSKPALWTQAFPGQKQQPLQKEPQKFRHPRKRIRTFSDRRAKLNAIYRREAAQFVKELNDAGERCPVVKMVEGLRGDDTITDVHHMRGRAGAMLLDKRYWVGVSRLGHDWIGNNMDRARTLGFLCAKGLWLVQDPP